MIRIALVDDQQLVRLGFRMIIDGQPDMTVVGEAGDGTEAVQLARRMQPDIMLMDVRMPRIDGITATRQITSEHPDTKIIILTTFDLDEYAFGGIRAGASGFLLKDSQANDLTNAIHAVATGEAVISPRVTRRMLDIFGHQLPAQDQASDPLAALTPREREVFLAIAHGHTNTEIADKLFLTESTVKTHVGRVLSKLGLRDRVHAVIYAYEQSLIR